MERQRRMAVARQALLQAETAVGLYTRLPAGQPKAASSDAAQQNGVQHSSAQRAPAPQGDSEGFSLPAPLRRLLPMGLRAGSTVEVRGSSSLLLAMAAAAMVEAERWLALVGLPHIGVPAAVEAGVPLDRTVVVPTPGSQVAEVLAALMEGFDVLALGATPGLREADRRRLHTRLRTRGAVLLSTDWPGSDLQLAAQTQHATGLGQGWGAVTERQVDLVVGGRMLSRHHRLTVRFDSTGIHEVAEPGPTSAEEGRSRLRAVS